MADGIVFEPDSVRADEIREDNTYGGIRINLVGRINAARCSLQIDIGFGDAVTPTAETIVFPTLLNDFQAPMLKVYPIYTVIAEKYQAMVLLELANSRMKDFYDLAVIARRTDLDGKTLAKAIAATFARRNSPLPLVRPLVLTDQFSKDAGKRHQWQAFLKKNRIDGASLEATVELLERLLWQPTEVASGKGIPLEWIAAQGCWV